MLCIKVDCIWILKPQHAVAYGPLTIKAITYLNKTYHELQPYSTMYYPNHRGEILYYKTVNFISLEFL